MHGFAEQKIAIIALVLFCGLLLFACSNSLTAEEELTLNIDYEQVDLNSEEEEMVDIQDNQNETKQDLSTPAQEAEGSPVSEDSKAGQSSSNNSAQVITLILNLEEVSRESFLAQHGKQALQSDPLTANATRIGKIEINQNILTALSIGEGEQLKLQVFNDLEYTIAVKKVESGQVVSIHGTTTDASSSPFYLSIHNKTVSATLELPAYNLVYLIKYNPTISGYYLFQTPLQNLDVLEGAPPLIPSGPDN